MKYFAFLAVITLATGAIAGEQRRPAPQLQIAETIQQIMMLRQQVTAFYANPNADAVQTIRDRWQEMPAEVRTRIEGRHPGTSTRILMLDSEIPPPEPAPKEAAPTTNTVTTQDIWKTSGATTESKDQWATTTPPPKVTEVNTTPLLYSDDLDIFGNRPKPRIKR